MINVHWGRDATLSCTMDHSQCLGVRERKEDKVDQSCSPGKAHKPFASHWEDWQEQLSTYNLCPLFFNHLPLPLKFLFLKYADLGFHCVRKAYRAANRTHVANILQALLQYHAFISMYTSSLSSPSTRIFTVYIFHLHGWLVALETATDGYHLGWSGFMRSVKAQGKAKHVNFSCLCLHVSLIFFSLLFCTVFHLRTRTQVLLYFSLQINQRTARKKGHQMTCQKDVFYKQSSNLLSFSELSEPDTWVELTAMSSTIIGSISFHCWAFILFQSCVISHCKCLKDCSW